jgi:hypothetical protein
MRTGTRKRGKKTARPQVCEQRDDKTNELRILWPVFRLTRREQIFIILFLTAIFVGAIVKHFRDAAAPAPPLLENSR